MSHIKNKNLITDEGILTFQNHINMILELDDITVVLLEYGCNAEDINNIYGVKNGQIIWQIQDMREYNPAYANPLLPQQNPYTLIGLLENDTQTFFATTWHGFCFKIDPQTGRIVGDVGFVK